jgi:hypothetical protein
MERMRDWVTEAGRDFSSFGVDRRIQVGQGTADDWRRDAEEWKTLGATHLSLVSLDGGLAGPGEHLERLREAREALEP